MMRYYLNLFSISAIVFILIAGNPAEGRAQVNRINIARSLEKKGSYREALNIYLQSYRNGIFNHQIYSGIKNSYLNLRRYTELISFYNEIIKKHPGQPVYVIDLGSAYFLDNQKEKAIDSWNQALILGAKKINAYRFVAMAMINLHLFDEAIEVYKKAISNLPKQEMLYRDIASLYKARLNYEGAVYNNLLYYSYLKKQFQYVRLQIISLTKDDEAVDRIIETIKQFQTAQFNDARIEELLADMYIKKKNWDRAYSIYKSLNRSQKKAEYLVRFAREAEKNGAYEYALKAYSLLSSKDITGQQAVYYTYLTAKNYYLIGRRLIKNHREEEAHQKVEYALQLLDSVSAQKISLHSAISSMELKAGIYTDFYNDIDQAVQIYQTMLKMKISGKVKSRVQIKLADSYILKNELTKAENIYSGVTDKEYKKQAAFNLAEIQFFRGALKKAQFHYNQLSGKLSAEDTLTNNVLERISFIEEHKADSGAVAEFAAAELLKRQKKLSEAAQALRELQEKNNSLSILAGLKAGELYLELSKLHEGQAVILSLIAGNPDSDKLDKAYFLLAEIYRRDKDLNAALENYRVILSRYPSSFYLDEARERARAVSALIKETKQQ